ncbi:MAG TPA: PilZ domain-containing protein [Bryobacteraceae bacterium]|jgi:hypothetical protein|nr:PilZ domain-containing protein [Bryobacteraceae bacterium]
MTTMYPPTSTPQLPKHIDPQLGSGAEQRREARYPTCEVVEVAVIGEAGLVLTGVLRDVSKNGLRVELRVPVPAGAHLKVAIGGRAVIFAVARYCHPTTDTFHVGAAIEEVYYPNCNFAGSDAYAPMDAIGSHQLAQSIVTYYTSSRPIVDPPETRMSPLADALC